MTDWTTEQLQAITQRGSNLMVSAAAGSGKTAVLANRVVKYIENGGSLDRLLVVTFTRLAAGEMRERIGRLLSSADFADKAAFRRQKLLLGKAKICTIDSFFCDIVRENFRISGISPDFRLLDEAEYSYIKTEILDKLLEEYYADYHGNFGELIRLFGGDGEDAALSEQISRLYVFLQSLPFPKLWAEEQKKAYKSPEIWLKAACEELLPEVEEFLNIYAEIIDEMPFNDKGMAVVYRESEMLKALIQKLKANDFDSAKHIAEFEFERSPSCSKADRTMQKYKLFRANLKDFLNQPLFLTDTSVLLTDLDAVRDGVECLLSITLEYSDRIYAEMKRINAFSFDAISHIALSLTVNKDENGNIERTEYAENLSKSFDEILIDEYQDVNDLQDCFFNAISNENCFAVGDVKQSIYMFRQANPDNFLRREKLFPVIYLNKNFRSRKGVLDFCNFIFESAFSENVGGMEYGKNEALYCGAEYPEKEESDVEINLISRQEDEESPEIQARFTARRIKQLVNSGMTVGRKGEEKPVDFSDFAVIMRSYSPVASIWENVFFEENVPCRSKTGSNFITTPEVATVVAFLNAIDNPYDDLSLFAAMFSPIGGFSADEIAKIKLEGKKDSLYNSLKKRAENNGKSEAFLKLHRKFTIFAATLPIHKLVWELFEQTGYLSAVSCMTFGDMRREHLMSFYAFSRSYSEKNAGSLYDFLKFTEDAAQSPTADSESSVPAGNFVNIMTVHASKGLEFPIVFIPQVDKGFNGKDLSKPLLIEKSIGIGTNLRDADMTYEQTTFMREVIQKRLRRKAMSENLRLLYVAFTRAKEKLIIVSSGESYDEEHFSQIAIMSQNARIYPSQIIYAKNFEKIILQSLVSHPKCKPLHTEFSDVSEKECEDVDVFLTDELPEDVGVKAAFDTDLKISYDELVRRCRRADSDLLSKTPAKLSVTEIAKNIIFDEKSEELIAASEPQTIPQFISKTQTGLTAAQSGTAVHIFLSKADLNKPFYSELDRLSKGKYLDEAQKNAVKMYKNKIEAFAKSDIYKLICSAKTVRKEEYFLSSIPSERYKGAAGGAILIQGAIDVLCDLGESLVIIDYKTDSADSDELIKRYEKQLDFYAGAAEKCYGKPVSGIYLWSLHLSEKVEIKRKENR